MKPLPTNSGGGGVRGVDVVGRVEALQRADDLLRLGVVVGLAGVGARDPADDVGLRVDARRREVAHRPPGHERLADRLPRPGRELRGGDDRVGERGLEDADGLGRSRAAASTA